MAFENGKNRQKFLTLGSKKIILVSKKINRDACNQKTLDFNKWEYEKLLSSGS